MVETTVDDDVVVMEIRMWSWKKSKTKDDDGGLLVVVEDVYGR